MGGADPPRALYVGAPGNSPCTRGPTTFTIGRAHKRHACAVLEAAPPPACAERLCLSVSGETLTFSDFLSSRKAGPSSCRSPTGSPIHSALARAQGMRCQIVPTLPAHRIVGLGKGRREAQPPAKTMECSTPRKGGAFPHSRRQSR